MVMTKLKELGGTTLWFDDVSTFSITSIFYNALATTFKSKGKYIHSSATPGQVTLTEDLIIKSTSSPEDITIRPGVLTLANEQVAYINLAKSQKFNSFDQMVSFTNGVNYINTVGGSVGFFANLSKGDWVRAASDGIINLLQVQEFYDTVNLGGSVTTAANARSVRLSGNYQGTTNVDIGRYDRGIYQITDVIIQDRSNPAIAAAGGNFLWLVLRSDTIMNIASIASIAVSGTITEANGLDAQFNATGHGLVDGDRITITSPAGQAGTYTVDVQDANSFFIKTTNTTMGAFTGFYGLATTAARTNGFGVQVESANHGFESGETIQIAGTTSFNGPKVINRRSDTQFEFPMSSGGSPLPPGSPALLTSSVFGVLAASTITNTGFTVVTGDLGLYPGTSVTGFPPGTVSGTQHITDAVAQQAQIDALAAYTDLSTRTSTVIPSALDGQVLTAGVYSFSSGAATLATSGAGTLTFSGSATDIFVIQTASTLTTGAGGTPTITLTGGALSSNVYWVIGSSATINAGNTGVFRGTLIANTSITDTLGGSVDGRLIALNGAVTLSAAAAITVPTGGGGPVIETSGTATLARLDVRSEEGITKVVQGETIDIGEGDSDNIQRFIGMDSLAETSPIYFIPGGYNTLGNGADYNTDPVDNLTRRASKLTAMMADKAQDKTVKYLTNATNAVNTTNGSAQELTFTPPGSTLTILLPGSQGNAVVTLPSVTPGISLLVNQSAYVVVDRNNATTPSIIVTNTSTVPVDENVFVIATRLAGNAVYLWNGQEVLGSVALVQIGDALVKVTFYDPTRTTLPTGNPVNVDGVSVLAGETVLFSALLSGNNRIYLANGSGTNITSWTAQFSFNGLQDPTNGDTVMVLKGNGFADQIGKFTGLTYNPASTWVFNDKVRYFNGTDYWEQSSLFTTTLTDATTNNVFTVNFSGSEYMIVDYSVSRGVFKETGSIYIVTDGTLVSVVTAGANLNGQSGVTFAGDISGALIRLRYTLTATGSNATMKYMVRRWSNAAGGPGGVPSYAPATAPVPAAGSSGNIQFNTAGLLDGNNNFNIDTVDLSVNLNGYRIGVLSSAITLADNIASPTNLFTFLASYKFAVIEYSIVRNGFSRVGRLIVANDGSITSESDDFTETGITGVTLTAVMSGANVQIKYTTTATGNSGTFKYSIRKWS